MSAIPPSVPRLSDFSPPPAEPSWALNLFQHCGLQRSKVPHSHSCYHRHPHRVTAYQETRANFPVLSELIQGVIRSISFAAPGICHTAEQPFICSSWGRPQHSCFTQRWVDPRAQISPRCDSLKQPAALKICLLIAGRRKKQRPPICRCDPQLSHLSCAATCLRLRPTSPPVQLAELFAPQALSLTPLKPILLASAACLDWIRPRSTSRLLSLSSDPRGCTGKWGLVSWVPAQF